MTRERKVVIIVGVLLLVAGSVYRFLPANGNVVGSDPIEAKQKMLIKYSQLIRDNTDIDERLAQAGKVEKAMNGMLLTGQTPALAAVDIQNTLARLAQRTKVRIDRVSVIKPEKLKKDELMAIPVQFSVNASVRQLRDLIAAIESSDKLLRITDISSRAREKEGSAVTVSTTITIEGFIFEG